MQATKQSQIPVSLRVHKDLKSIYHFGYLIQLPSTAQIYQYRSKFTDPNKKSKLKHKYDKFTYYKDLKTDEIIKILFINEQKYVDQGKYPFTEPLGNIGNFSQLNVKRVKTTQAAYIGHFGQDLIVKKIQGVKLGQNGTEFQTVDDKFEILKLDNENRFTQFLKLMGINQNSISMSIRVIIQQSEQKKAQIIDYEFFYRQQQLIRNKKNSVNSQQKQQQI